MLQDLGGAYLLSAALERHARKSESQGGAVVIFQVVLVVVAFATIALGVTWWATFDLSHDNAVPAILSTATTVLAMGAQLIVRLLDVSVAIADTVATIVIVAGFMLMCGKFIADKRAELERWQRAVDLTSRHMPG